MIKELVTDESVLSQPCEKATADDAELAQDLLDTLASHDDASCLAANQIGVTKAVFAYLDDDDRPHVVFNPAIKRAFGPYKASEGCLSREDESKVTRFAKVQVTYEELVDGALVARTREFTDWQAQVMQHMIDHCKGKLV